MHTDLTAVELLNLAAYGPIFLDVCYDRGPTAELWAQLRDEDSAAIVEVPNLTATTVTKLRAVIRGALDEITG